MGHRSSIYALQLACSGSGDSDVLISASADGLIKGTPPVLPGTPLPRTIPIGNTRG
jgi:hypothetical protein